MQLIEENSNAELEMEDWRDPHMGMDGTIVYIIVIVFVCFAHRGVPRAPACRDQGSGWGPSLLTWRPLCWADSIPPAPRLWDGASTPHAHVVH